MDNINYQRYSGELQILRTNHPQDDRVNVIGHVDECYRDLLPHIRNGQQVRFIALI